MSKHTHKRDLHVIDLTRHCHLSKQTHNRGVSRCPQIRLMCFKIDPTNETETCSNKPTKEAERIDPTSDVYRSATLCDTLQHAATLCNTLQHAVTHTLQHMIHPQSELQTQSDTAIVLKQSYNPSKCHGSHQRHHQTYTCACTRALMNAHMCVCVSVFLCCYACTAVCCGVLRCVAVCRRVLQCVAVRCRVLHYAAVRCNMLQCVIVWCSVMHCVPVFGCEFLYVAVYCKNHDRSTTGISCKDKRSKHPAKTRNTLQHSRTLCATIQDTAILCRTLQHTATQCRVTYSTSGNCCEERTPHQTAMLGNIL